MGVMVKQWLTEYSWTIGSKVTSPHETTILRQFRFEGLTAWRIPQIISYIPCQLILSVFLFLAGLLCFLWDVHRAVAIPSTVLVSFTVLSFIFTSIMPAFDPTCAYKSAQAWLAYRLLAKPVQTLLQTFGKPSAFRDPHNLPRGWTDAAMQHFKAGYGDAEKESKRWVSYDIAALSWIYSSLVPWDLSLADAVRECAIGGPDIQVTHTLLRSHFSSPLSSSEVNTYEDATSTINVTDSKIIDLENHSALQSLPNVNQLAVTFASSTKLFLDGDTKKDSWGSSNFDMKLYEKYLNALIRSDTTIPFVSLHEYILVFRVLYFRLLGKVIQWDTRLDADKISQGTRALAKFLSLLDCIPSMDSSFRRGLQKMISDDLRKVTLMNWRSVDNLRKVNPEHQYGYPNILDHSESKSEPERKYGKS